MVFVHKMLEGRGVGYLPLNPTLIGGDIRVHSSTSGALLFVHNCLPQHNTHPELHSWRNRIHEVQGINYLAIVSAYHFIVTPLNEVSSNAISAVKPDNIVKILMRRRTWVEPTDIMVRQIEGVPSR